MTEDTRYPYTYACDLIRTMVGFSRDGTKLSRSDASQIRRGIAEVLDMNDYDLAIKLADHYKSNEAAITEKSVAEFVAQQR